MLVTFQPVDERTGTALDGAVVINLDHVSKVEFHTAARGQGLMYARLYHSSDQGTESVYVASSKATAAMKAERVTAFLEVLGADAKPVFSSTKDSTDPR